MTKKRFILPIIFLQFLPIILYPLEILQSGFIAIGGVFLLFLFLGYGIWRGRIWGLVMSIFLQGFNIVIRMMMFFAHAVSEEGVWDITYASISLLAMIISGWFLIRLDKPDVHSLITT